MALNQTYWHFAQDCKDAKLEALFFPFRWPDIEAAQPRTFELGAAAAVTLIKRAIVNMQVTTRLH